MQPPAFIAKHPNGYKMDLSQNYHEDFDFLNKDRKFDLFAEIMMFLRISLNLMTVWIVNISMNQLSQLNMPILMIYHF